jgi:hypothetical protein
MAVGLALLLFRHAGLDARLFAGLGTGLGLTLLNGIGSKKNCACLAELPTSATTSAARTPG